MWLQIGGVFIANFSVEGEAKCVPAWVFAGVFQPVLSFIVFVHGYGKLNMAIERDVDQDIGKLRHSHERIKGSRCEQRAVESAVCERGEQRA